jgi:hypothetical protein
MGQPAPPLLVPGVSNEKLATVIGVAEAEPENSPKLAAKATPTATRADLTVLIDMSPCFFPMITQAPAANSNNCARIFK